MEVPESPNLREKRIVIYLTEEDGNFLNGLYRQLGFKSRSSMIASMLERLIIGGFSLRVFFQLGVQMTKLAIKTGAAKEAGFYFGIRPLPELPIDDVEVTEEKEAIATLKKEIK
jgi:hypothetical protein